MLNFFKKTNKDDYIGVVADKRSKAEKEKDWMAEEVFSPAPASFRVTNDPSEWKRYQIRNQDGSGSCVANTVAKMLEVKRFLEQGDSIKFSHAPIYINRSNKPGSGMIGVNALELAKKVSSCKEEDFPSENKNDKQLDALVMPANYEELNNLVKPTNYVILPNDFDYVASMIEQEGCAMIWVDSSNPLYQKDIPVKGGKGKGVRHSITGIDTVTYKGEQYIVIEDSWGKFGTFNGQRLLSREFFADAVFFCAVLTNFEYNVSDVVDKKQFSTIMKFGDKNQEVKRYQDYLKSKGFFPSNVASTGYFGSVTAKATYNFQVAYKVASMAELNSLAGKRVGAKTLAVINNNL